MFVTSKTLETMPSGQTPCITARNWFAQQFPEGADFWKVWDACQNPAWQVWATCHSLGKLGKEDLTGLVWRFAGQAVRLIGVNQYADSVSPNNWKEVRSHLLCLPDLGDAERREAILSLDYTAQVTARSMVDPLESYIHLGASDAVSCYAAATHAATAGCASVFRERTHGQPGQEEYNRTISLIYKEQAEWCAELWHVVLARPQQRRLTHAR